MGIFDFNQDLDDAIAILKDFVEADRPGDGGRDAYCFYCDVHEGEKHRPECPLLRARVYLRERGVDLETVA